MDFGAGQIVPSMGAQSPRPSMASARPTQGTIGQTPGIARPLARRCPIAPAPGTCCTGPSALPGLPIRPGHFSVFGTRPRRPGAARSTCGRSLLAVPPPRPALGCGAERPVEGPSAQVRAGEAALARQTRRPARQPARGVGPSRRAPADRGIDIRHIGGVGAGDPAAPGRHHHVRRRRHPRGPARPGPPYIEGAPVLNESRTGRAAWRTPCGGALRAEAGGGTSAGPHGRPHGLPARRDELLRRCSMQRRTPRSTIRSPWWTRWASPTDGAGGRGRLPINARWRRDPEARRHWASARRSAGPGTIARAHLHGDPATPEAVARGPLMLARWQPVSHRLPLPVPVPLTIRWPSSWPGSRRPGTAAVNDQYLRLTCFGTPSSSTTRSAW